MNSAFRARWLASSEVISQILFTSKQPTKMMSVYCHKQSYSLNWYASYSAYVVYTKTIIHLSVGTLKKPLNFVVISFCALDQAKSSRLEPYTWGFLEHISLPVPFSWHKAGCSKQDT